MLTSTVLPGKIQWHTGSPSRVTARPNTSCGASSRPFFDLPRRRSIRDALYGKVELTLTEHLGDDSVNAEMLPDHREHLDIAVGPRIEQAQFNCEVTMSAGLQRRRLLWARRLSRSVTASSSARSQL